MVTDVVDVVQAVVEVKLIFLEAGVRILKTVFPGVPVRERSDERLSLCFLLGNDLICTINGESISQELSDFSSVHTVTHLLNEDIII